MKFHSKITFVLPTILLMSGCATNPDKLQSPPQLTCIHVKEPLVFVTITDLTIRIEKGAYWSEKMDDRGVYYRGPAGAVSVRNKDGSGYLGQQTTMDGGFYVPTNPTDSVRLYKYISFAPAAVQVPADEADCSTLAYAKDPITSKVSVGPWMAMGAAGGMAGGLAARGMAEGGNMSYGQAAGVGAAGGVIAGAIIGVALNAEVGKIDHVTPPLHGIPTGGFLGQLRILSANAIVIKEVKAEPGGAAGK